MTDDPFPSIQGSESWTARNSNRSPGIGYRPSQPELAEFWGANTDGWGGVPSERSALAISAFFCGVSLISEAMASMPLKVYKERKSGGWDYQDDHPVNYCLFQNTNGWQTPAAAKSLMQTHLFLSGNSISTIKRNGRGQAISFNPVMPVNVKFYIEQDNTPSYAIRDYPLADSEQLIYAKGERSPSYMDYRNDEVLHLKGFGVNPYVGLSTLFLARNGVNLTRTIEEFGRKFFNKGRPAGFLTKPGNISKDQRKVLTDEWEELQEGVRNAFSIGILSGGLDWKALGVTADDAQFLSNREFQVLEMARWLRIPPHMLGEVSKATNSNIETLTQEFITYTLLPWITRWEEELNLKMFTQKEHKMGFGCYFDVNNFLRGNSKTNSDIEKTDISIGKRTPDEVRVASRLNPYPNGIGSKPLVMASQLDLLERVDAGTSQLASSGGDNAPGKKPSSAK